MLNAPLGIYKVNLETGKQTLLRSVRLKTYANNILKNIIGTSGTKIVYNFMSTGGITANMQGALIYGLPTSYIVPDAVLIEEIEAESIMRPMSIKKHVVPNPLNSN